MDRAIRLLGSCPGRLHALATVLLAAALPAAAAGCAPKIGDKCVLSTDCSQQGTLVCDTSQPEGYCTQLNCTNGSCPNDAVCVLFQAAVPGCAYDDYQSPSRTGRSFCMAHCGENSDCRQSDGYICRDPTSAPWNAAILDNNQAQQVCIVSPAMMSSPSDPDAAVCMSYATDAAQAEAPEGGDASEADAEGAADASRDAEIDATPDAGVDATPDAGVDATLDAPTDTGSADAPGGG
jgi:hypothetical protein